MPNLFAEIRSACAAVAARARAVRVVEERIAQYGATLPLEQIAAPEHDAPTHYLGHGEGTVAFFLTIDAINFGSGYFPFLRKRAGMSGYFTVAASLNDYYQQHGPLSAAQLAALTPDDCARIFGQSPAQPPIDELMMFFAQALNELGRLVGERFDGSFGALVAAADHSAERLARLLTEMPLFRDVARYDGFAVPLYKRAQIAAADLALAFNDAGPGAFTDLDDLTIFADNLVPHVLRHDGILAYNADLAARIDREEMIVAGSPEEVELRACAIHAVELIVASLRANGHKVSARQLDFLLWNRGQQPAYKQGKPRHRTRSVFY